MTQSLPADEPAAEIRTDRRKARRHKLVVEISTDLHERILRICGTRKLPVNEAVRQVLERSFPG